MAMRQSNLDDTPQEYAERRELSLPIMNQHWSLPQQSVLTWDEYETSGVVMDNNTGDRSSTRYRCWHYVYCSPRQILKSCVHHPLFVAFFLSFLSLIIGIALLFISDTPSALFPKSSNANATFVWNETTQQELYLRLRSHFAQVLKENASTAAAHTANINTAMSFQRPEDPAYKALEWLVTDSTSALLNDERLEQRFALACLFYSWAGPAWALQPADGWIQDHQQQQDSAGAGTTTPDECSWRAVECDAQGRVIALWMGGGSTRAVVNNASNATAPGSAAVVSNNASQAAWLAAPPATTSGPNTTAANGSSGFLPSLLVGTIPSELGLLSNLLSLDFSNQQLRGGIPELIYQRLTALEYADFSQNRLVDPISPSIGYWTNLKTLLFHENILQGTVPEESFQQLTALQQLSFKDNADLNGNIWELLSFWPSLEYIDVGATSLTGTLPDQLCVTTSNKLRVLASAAAPISGTIPSSIGHCTALTALSIRPAPTTNQNTDVKGPIPTQIGLLTKLTLLLLADKIQLNGTIPTELGLLVNLRFLTIQNRGISGTIPTELGLLTELTILDLSQTSLTGSVPVELGRLTKLTLADFVVTELSGTMPDAVCAIASLHDLQADCGMYANAKNPEIECSCCSYCFGL